jgi:hypothetical protein
MVYGVSYVDLKSLADSNYSMGIHGVIGAGWSTWRKYPCHSLSPTTTTRVQNPKHYAQLRMRILFLFPNKRRNATMCLWTSVADLPKQKTEFVMLATSKLQTRVQPTHDFFTVHVP